MAPTCHLWGSVGKVSEKGQWPLLAFLSGRKLFSSSDLIARHFISFLYATGVFKLLPSCWNSEGVSLSKTVWGFFKGNCLGLQKFLPQIQSPVVFASTSYENLSSWHWNPGQGGLVWDWDSSLLRYPS